MSASQAQNKCVIKNEDNQIQVSHGARNIKTNTRADLTKKKVCMSPRLLITHVHNIRTYVNLKNIYILHSRTCDARGEAGYIISFIITCSQKLVYFTACLCSKTHTQRSVYWNAARVFDFKAGLSQNASCICHTLLS